MAKLRALLKRVRLVYRRSSTLTKTVVMSTIVVSMAALLAINAAIGAAEKAAAANTDQAAQLEQENEKYKDGIGAQGSIEGAEQFAKDELDMVPTDAVVIAPGTN